MATPDQIRRRGRWSLIVGTLIAALTLGAAAIADNTVADGDGVTPVANNDMAFGDVNCGVATDRTALIAISRNGNYATAQVFQKSSTVTVTVQSVTGTGLSAVMGATTTISIPSNWDTAANNTLTAAVSSTVTVNSSAPGAGSGSVVYRATGTKSDGTTPFFREDTVNVSWTVLNNCAPPNSAPTANAGGPYFVGEGSSVTVTGSGSDPDTDPLTYAWDLDNNGTFETPGQNVTFSAAGRDGPSTQTVVLQVCDDESACATSSATVNITNVPPSITSVTNDGPVSEGSPATINMTATDPAGGLDPLSYEFDCDDDSVYEVGPQSGNSAQCTYPDGPSSHVVNVRVTDGDGGEDTDSTTVSVNDVAPTIDLSGAASVNEGASYSLTLGAITDPGIDTVTSWIVHWGDSSSDTYSSDGGKNHAYADGPATPTITVDLVDEDGTHLAAGTTSITVENVAPTADLGNNGPVDEGSPATISFSNQSDPSSDDTAAGFHYAYACNNGDLNGATYAGSGASAFTMCTYPDGPSTHTVKARIIDKDDGYTEYTTVVTVDNVKPTVTSLVAGSATSCGSANSLTINFTDPAGVNDTYSASIDWGDGNTDMPGNITSPYLASHTYASAGPHTVTVTVSDEDGGTSAVMQQTLIVNYNTSGILQPINPGPPMSIFKFGSTIPVKIKITDCDGSYPSTLGPKVTYQKLSSGTPVNGELEPYSTSAADTGNTMRFDATSMQYIFNLASKSFGDPTSQWRIIITIPSSGQKITADIGLKS